MNKLFSILFISIMLTQATCWWQLGHILVAQIAKDRLIVLNNTAALSKMTQLIKAFQNLTDGKSNTFIEAAVWSDDIKQYGIKMFDEYHFTNVVFDPDYLFKGMTDFQTDVNAMNILGWCQTVLKTNKDGITFERAFMARYLLHLVGDSHQPLHSVNGFSKAHKTGDLGGNLIKIITTNSTNSTTLNLHAYLDSMAGLQSYTQRLSRPLTVAQIDFIESMAAIFTRQNPVSSFTNDQIQNKNYHDWIVQSFSNAAVDVYPNVSQGKQITDQFDAKMKALCKKRIALAGYRLAYIIQSIYA